MQYIRTNIYLTELQKQILKDVATAQGLKTAELVRRILDEYLIEVKRKDNHG